MGPAAILSILGTVASAVGGFLGQQDKAKPPPEPEPKPEFTPPPTTQQFDSGSENLYSMQDMPMRPSAPPQTAGNMQKPLSMLRNQYGMMPRQRGWS